MKTIYIYAHHLTVTTPEALRATYADALLVLVGKSVAAAFGLGYLPYSIATMPTGHPVAVVPPLSDSDRTTKVVAELRALVEAAKAAAA